jgi:predicted RNA-binding protein with PIN domain
MPYLIDGNNLMHRGQTRIDLLKELAQFANLKKVQMTVVFDGAPETNFPDNSSFQRVKVYYSVRGSNADARIKSFVESSKERRTLFVITSDRALADYVRRCGAKTINCREFRQRMMNLPPQKKEKIANENVKQEEMAEWLRYFGVDEND